VTENLDATLMDQTQHLEPTHGVNRGRPLRILRIADIANNRTGGMSRTMYCTGDELERLGHSVDYWFGDTLRAERVKPQLKRFVMPWRVVREFQKAQSQGRTFDVVEIHEPLAAMYAWHRGRLPPLVIFSYGLEERSHRATLAYRRKRGLPISIKMRYSPLSVVAQAAYAVRHAAHVICSNSEDVEYLRRCGIAPDKLTRHHSGVEKEFLEAGAQAASASTRRGILFLGGWLERKGIRDLVPAVEKVLLRDASARFTAAGCHASEPEVRSGFSPQVRDRVQVVPSIANNDELIPLYRDHSIFVLPSYFEGQPLAMIEAAAMGLAIVTTNTCGMKDFIVDGHNGVLVPWGDPDALADALLELSSQPGRMGELGANARKTAQDHSWKSAAEKIAAAYYRAIGSAAHGD
jgi:glycosyltransferase involved in cell wall biosynthesis